MTLSNNIGNLTPLYYILSLIYIKNPLNFNLVLLNHSIKNILIFINPILLILTFNTTLFPIN